MVRTNIIKTYREIRNRREDFIVRYKLYFPQDGGRKVTFQHLRCDFMYEGDDPEKDGIYMIHPEFLNENGDPVSEDTPVSLAGKASMWVIVEEMKEKVHRQRVKIGVHGYFMEGARKIGEVVVEEIVGLSESHA